MEENKGLTTTNQNNLMTTQQSATFCSFDTTTKEGKAKLFNVMTNPDKRVADQINMTIEVKDIYAETVEIANQDTGELENVPRCILIDAKGVSYVAVSKGIFGDLKRLISIFGPPAEWEKPLKLTVKQVTVKAGSMLKLQLAE